ncbi:MAG: hypothetical protein PHT44_00270 [Candidatus Portnoybacteria bacterium]|nr:hypothetical protein [Candidatus Portnoybacteria bacterium]MDD4982948.1 hypothetical protein [Candidatus Portnoybacteria bacterium]
MKKAIWWLLTVCFALFAISDKSEAERLILFDGGEKSAAYLKTVDEVVGEVKTMIRETGCVSYDKGKVYIAVSEEKRGRQVVVYFIDQRLGQIEEVSSALLRPLSLLRERKDFAVKTARCLYFFYEVAGNE